MRKDSLALVLCTVTLIHVMAVAQASTASPKQRADDTPQVVISGLQTYKDKGATEALKTWLKASPLEGSKDALTQANNLRQIEDYYGSFKKYEVLATRTVSSSTRMDYVVLNYDKGPLFARFVSYKTDDGWILVSFDFNTKVDMVIPSSVGAITTR
jgi:hypothetical protein